MSLFHYRNHGHDIGRVLVGVQVQDEERESWHTLLDDLGYKFVDETSNPVYRQFLR